jgi:hypothetical protein
MVEPNGGFRFTCVISRIFTLIQLTTVKAVVKCFTFGRRSGRCSVLNSVADECARPDRCVFLF